jgi:hypothetical protein
MKFLYYTYYRINSIAIKISDDALNKFKAPFLIIVFECLLYYQFLFWIAIITGAEWMVHNKLFYIIPSSLIVIFYMAFFDFNKNLKNEIKECSHYPNEKKKKWDIYIILIMVLTLFSVFFSGHELHQLHAQ